MEVDEGAGAAPAATKTPEERLERLEAALDERDDVGEPDFLTAAAEVAKVRWIVARRRTRAAKTEQKEIDADGTVEQKAAAAEKVQLAEAEAELAEAEAELAEAKAELAEAKAKLAEAESKGQPTEALNNRVTACQNAVNLFIQARLTKRSRGELSENETGEPRAKRARLCVRVRPERLPRLPPPEKDPPLLARDEATRSIQRRILQNSAGHGNPDSRPVLGVLAAVGHVRVGKTRLALQVAREIQAMQKEAWLEPQLITINFQNGSNYVGAMDGRAFDIGRACDHASRLAGVRMAYALKALFREGENEPVKLSSCSYESLSEDVSIGAVVTALVREVNPPQGKRLPIVVHLDEYGYYVRDTGRDGESEDKTRLRHNKAREVMLSMVRRICNDLLLCADVKDDVRDRFFVVPIVTGTSFHDIRINPCGFAVSYLPTPLFSYEESKTLLHEFWTRRDVPMDMPDEGTKAHESLLVALSDTSGFPGLVRMVADIDEKSSKGCEAVQYLAATVLEYSKPLKQPALELWSLLMRLLLSRQPVRRNTLVWYREQPDEGMVVRSIGELMDKGYVRDSSSGLPTGRGFTLTTAVCLMRAWQTSPDVLNLDAMPDATPSKPWTWQQFEIMHANFFAAALSAMFRLSKDYVAGANVEVPKRYQREDEEHTHYGKLIASAPTLRRLLRGALPRHAPLLNQRITGGPQGMTWGLDEQKCIVHDPRHVLHCGTTKKQKKKREAAEDTVSLEMDGVHLCLDGNPVVDAYVNLELDGVPTTVFLQYKHSKLTADGRVAMDSMNEDRARLDWYLAPRHKKVWSQRHVVLLYVTNRRLSNPRNLAAADGLFYVSRDELPEHLGPEFAGRGLLPESVARS